VYGINSRNKIHNKQKNPYKLSKGTEKKIIELVKGKKESTEINATETKTLINQLIGKSFICDVNPMDNKDKFVGYTKLNHRIDQKKNNTKD
jgi:hypothetical protein